MPVLGPPWPVKPESKNPGGIPNVAAELPLCPLLPICQAPVLPLEWLPGKTAGLVPGELEDGWPESVEEQGLLLLVWRRNIRNDI